MTQSAIVFTAFRRPRGSVVGIANAQGIPGAVNNTIFVDTVNGDDTTGNGTPYKPFQTMAAAFEVVCANDSIIFTGKVKEQLVAPLLGADGAVLTGVKIIGAAGGGVRDDDGAKWTYPDSGATAGKALLACRQQGWSVENFLMTPEPTSGACVKLNRAEDAVNPDASHFIARNMRFVGIDVTTTYGIQDVGGCSNVLVENCEFYLLTIGLYSSSQAIATPLRWKVLGNRFIDNTNDIDVPSSRGLYQGNRHFSAAATKVIDIAAGALNIVTGNVFPDVAADIDPAHGYDGNADDTWTSNSAADAVVFGDPA